jgi:hypothetical protein
MTDKTRPELEAALDEAEKAYSAALTAQNYAVSHGGGDMTIARQTVQQLRSAVTLARRALIDFDAAELGGKQGQRVPVWR